MVLEKYVVCSFVNIFYETPIYQDEKMTKKSKTKL